MFNSFLCDSYRYTGSYRFPFKEFMTNHAVRYQFFLRCGGPMCALFRKHMQTKYGLELGDGSNIGPGLYLGHPYAITVNPKAQIGKNCNLHKGVTVGQENRGKRKGAPTIGSNVWIGSNATVVGRIHIGDNVLIAPNSYVNHDVPSGSIVIGNPSQVFPNDAATREYINNQL